MSQSQERESRPGLLAQNAAHWLGPRLPPALLGLEGDRTVILPGHRKADLLEAAGKTERVPGALTEPSTQGTVSPRHSRIGVLLSDIFLLYNLNRELVREESTDYIFLNTNERFH